MIKTKGPAIILAAFVLAISTMAAYYYGYHCAKRGIYIKADRNAPQSGTGAFYKDDLDRYFEPEERAEETQTAPPLAPLNLNTATVEELDTLPGIGEITAQKIIRYRETYGDFLTSEEIKAVDGIGEGTYQKIKGLIAVK